MTNHTFTIFPPFGSCNKSYLSLKMKPKQASFIFCRLRRCTTVNHLGCHNSWNISPTSFTGMPIYKVGS